MCVKSNITKARGGFRGEKRRGEKGEALGGEKYSSRGGCSLDHQMRSESGRRLGSCNMPGALTS